MKSILRLVPREHRRKAARKSHEIQILADMLRQIRRQLPPDPRSLLRRRLRDAVLAERYEEAAHLRDQIVALETRSPHVAAANVPGSAQAGAEPSGALAPRHDRPLEGKPRRGAGASPGCRSRVDPLV